MLVLLDHICWLFLVICVFRISFIVFEGLWSCAHCMIPKFSSYSLSWFGWLFSKFLSCGSTLLRWSLFVLGLVLFKVASIWLTVWRMVSSVAYMICRFSLFCSCWKGCFWRCRALNPFWFCRYLMFVGYVLVLLGSLDSWNCFIVDDDELGGCFYIKRLKAI